MILEDTVYNQLVEGTASMSFSDIPYNITEEHEVNYKSIEANMLKWSISEIITETTTDNWMSMTKELPMSSKANIAGTLSATMALDENLDNWYTMWLWHMLYRRSSNRKEGRSPTGKALMINAYCNFVEIPIRDNNLNTVLYITLHQLIAKSVSSLRFGEYSNKSITVELSFTYNNMEVDRVSKIIAR